MDLLKYLQSIYKINSDGIFLSEEEGYWSNLTKDENKLMVEAVRSSTARDALLKYQPQLEDVIYSPKRQAGLEHGRGRPALYPR